MAGNKNVPFFASGGITPLNRAITNDDLFPVWTIKGLWSTVTPQQLFATLGVLSVKLFGAKGDGRTDDTAAMQRAHNTGLMIYYPAGTYLYRSITIQSGGMSGDGIGSVLQCTDTSAADSITFTGRGAPDWNQIPTIQNLSIFGPNSSVAMPKTSGAGIYFNPTPNNNGQQFARICNVNFRYWPTCLRMKNTGGYLIEGCEFFFYRNHGIYAQNPDHPDVGDASILGCYFFNGGVGSTYATYGIGIFQEDQGGLRVVDNKFNGGRMGYMLNVLNTTSDLIVVGNSFENATEYSLRFENNVNPALPATGIRFGNIVISGNQFARSAQEISFKPIPNYLNQSYWDVISITGNTFYYRNNSRCIEVYTARTVSIQANAIYGESTGNMGTGVYIDASVTGGVLNNAYYSITTPVVNNGIAVTNQQAGGFIQYGTGSATTNAVQGALFGNSAAGSVNFPTAYSSPPDVQATLSGDAFAVSVVIVAITNVGFTFNVKGTINGSVVGFRWRAEGTV